MKKLLIANRGEIARRIMRTCREMGIGTVAVFSDPDRHALFAAEADEAVPLGGASPSESYLRIDALIAAAKKTGCDAIHPGYGFLSENAEFARACAKSGIVFVGPPVEAIAEMGSKIGAKQRMEQAGVPVLANVEVASGQNAALEAAVKKLGLPVLVKASAGGGGRGMRIVRKLDELLSAVETAQREAKSAFADDTVFIEPYVDNSRHVEIQIFGDTHGNVVHLFERECSIQRRYQKIVEESPSPAVDEKLRAAMGEAAVRAGQAIGYVGAGTVEFLLAPDGKFHFLEVNTRLQVEHPVTEAITGLDLVRLQIEVAGGGVLPDAARNPRRTGHAIEVRLYAEDPERDFLPSTGMLHRFRIPTEGGIRVDSGFADGSEVSPYYDSLLAKIIAHAPTRAEAAQKLAMALRRAQIHGLKTNRELLIRILEHPEFLAGHTDTHFLQRHPPAELGAPLGDAHTERIHALAAAIAAQASRRSKTTTLATIPSGWRNNPSESQHAKYTGRSGEISVDYRLHRGNFTASTNNAAFEKITINSATAKSVDLEIDDVRRTYEVHRVDHDTYVDSSLGSTQFTDVDRFPSPADEEEKGSLVAPLPGVVDDVRVQVGANVNAGDVLIVIESMKMLHRVTAPVSGRVTEIRVEKAKHVQAGAVLAVIEEASGGRKPTD